MLKVGVQSLGWYDKNDPLASFEYIKECGFEAVDFNIDGYLNTKKLSEEDEYSSVFDGSTEEVLEFFAPLKKASEQTGVSICQMHAPYPAFFDGLDKLNDYIVMALDKCFAVCEYVGCPAIVIHPSQGVDKEDEWEKNLTIYRRLIPIIKKYRGVKICLENLFAHQGKRLIAGRMSDAATSARMIDILNAEAGGDYFGFCFDIGHANLTNQNVRSFVKEMGDRLTIMHIHDNDAAGDLHVIPYTCLSPDAQNHICDWQGFVEALVEINFGGVICFETFRIFRTFPAPVHTDVLKLISAIGHYWAGLIDEAKKDQAEN